MLNLISINIKSTLVAVMVTKLCAVMMINIQNQYKFTEERIPFINSCNRCF